MFDRLIQLLENSGNAEGDSLDPLEIASAVAALYFHMIAADGIVTTVEIERFRAMLKGQFDLDDEELNQVAERGVQEDRASPGLFPFTSIVNSKLDADGRLLVLQHLEELAGADGKIGEVERDLLAHVQRLIRLD